MSVIDWKIKEFLNLNIGEDNYISLEPNELNPFLRCLEIMNRSCIVDMEYKVDGYGKKTDKAYYNGVAVKPLRLRMGI